MSGHGGGARRKRGGHGGGGGGGGGHGGGDSRWLVTYADLLTVLMALFLVLWTISTVDLNKFKKFTQGLGDFGNPAAKQVDALPDASPGTGSSDGGGTGSPSTEDTSVTTADPTATTVVEVVGPGGPELTISDLAGIADKLKTDLRNSAVPEGAGEVRIEDRGLVVSIHTDGVLFNAGSASMTAEGRAIISAIAPELVNISNRLIVEGHTDARPLASHTGYDNWDLSADRALSVLKSLVADFGFAPDRLSATGYGEFHPLDPAANPDAYARNRRVELVVVARKVKVAAPAATTAPEATTEATTDGTTAGPAAGGDTTATETATTAPAADSNP